MSSDAPGRPYRFVPVAALAGVVVGHWIAYLIAFPQAAGRGTALAESGHGYWVGAVALAIACAALAVSGTVVRHIRRALGRWPASPDRVRTIAIRLAGLQTSLFVVQEVLERLRVGAPLSELERGGFLLIGIAVQIAVAVGIALVLALLGRTAAAIGRALSKTPDVQRPESDLVGGRQVPPPQRVGATPSRPRAPPLPLAV
jgi:hypothetical protein